MTNHTTAASARKSIRRAHTMETKAVPVGEHILRAENLVNELPPQQDLPDWNEFLSFFGMLNADFRTWEGLYPTTPGARPGAGVWRRIEDFYAPMVRSWEAWKAEPSEARRKDIERATLAFWVGFGNASITDVSAALAPATVATWMVIQQRLAGVRFDSPEPDYFGLPKIPGDLLMDARNGQLSGRDNPTLCPTRSLNNLATFAIPQLPRGRYWRIRSPEGMHGSLCLDGDNVLEDFAGHARELLTGGVLRLWMTTWVLAGEREEHDGTFEFNPRHIICDLFGHKPEYVTNSHGKQYARAPRTMEQDLRTHLKTLQTIFLSGVGPVEADNLQPLIQRSEKSPRCYKHAPLAWQYARLSYTQVPRSVLRLKTPAVPLALGMANFWRARITSVLRGAGRYQTRLIDLATEVGEDHKARARRNGRSYWRQLIEDLQAVLQTGELGTLSVEGEGPEATVTLEPSPTLASVYQPLADAADRRRAEARKVKFEAEVRRQLVAGNKPKKGR